MSKKAYKYQHRTYIINTHMIADTLDSLTSENEFAQFT